MTKIFIFIFLSCSQVFANAAPQGPSGFEQFVPFLFILVIFYFFLIRPQQKRQKAHQEFLSQMKRGDTVVTSSGFIGKIHGITDVSISLELDPSTTVRILKSNIVRNFNEDKGEQDA